MPGNPSDSDYEVFHSDGDCVVRVENILFKIHRSFLSRDSSAFADMLTLPTGQDFPNQMTEADPLVLPDTIDDFRALCWALYALPPEVEAQGDPATFNFNKIFHLFSISHKYHFETYEKWAVKVLSKHCIPVSGGRNQFLDNESSCKTSTLEAMLRLCVRLSDQHPPSLTVAVEYALLRRLKGKPSVNIAKALTLAEELNLRRSQGWLYYYEAGRQPAFTSPSSTAYFFEFLSGTFTTPQILSFYRGCWSLSLYWTNLLHHQQTTKITHRDGCQQPYQYCQMEWQRLWSLEHLKQKLGDDGLSPANFGPLEKLKALQTSASPVAGTDLVKICLGACAQREITQLIKKLEDTLADHFLGPLPEAEKA